MLRSVPTRPIATPLIVSTLILLGALAGPGVSQVQDANRNPFSLGIFPSLWWTKMTKADVTMVDQVGSGPVLGEKIDFQDDFGLRNGPRISPGIKALMGYKGQIFLRGAYQEMRFRGSAWLDRDYEFSGYTAKQGTFLQSSFKFDSFEAGLQFNLINHEDIQLGILGEAKIYNLRIRAVGQGQEGYAGPLVSFSEKEEEWCYLPVFGLHLNLRPSDWLGIKGEVKGMKLNGISDLKLGVEDYTVFEAEAGLSVYLNPAIALTVGYRWARTDLTLDTEDPRIVEVETKAQGFLASIDIRF